MKSKNLRPVKWKIAILAAAIITAGSLSPAYCKINDVAVMIQQQPADSGQINIGTGIHNFEGNTELTLIATPKSGYRFVYWLGDVSDPTTASTIAYLNAPKIIIAVFEKDEYELAALEDETIQKGYGSGLLSYPAADYTRSGGGGGGGRRPRKWIWPTRPPIERPPDSDDFPVPGDDFPVPAVPEPATIALVAIGGLMAFTKKRRQKNRVRSL